MKNRAHHSGVKMTTYKAVFSIDQRVSLATSSLSDDVIQSINEEEDLDAVLNEVVSDGSSQPRETLNNIPNPNMI